MYSYEKNPDAIYQQSFGLIQKHLQEIPELNALPDLFLQVIIRMIHACGILDLHEQLAWSDNLLEGAVEGLEQPTPHIFCDCKMVAAGCIPRLFPASTEFIVTLDDKETLPLSRLMGTTRSAAALELWSQQWMQSGIVVIGNAPTALFHLLEGIEEERFPEPALILGFPVGFVGAAESKQALVDFPFKRSAYMTLLGNKGGSAIAAAAANGLASSLL